jgi:alpha,alpha-trehalase
MQKSLLHEVQMNNVFSDGKTFVDCTPNISMEEINRKFEEQRNNEGFNLSNFVKKNFSLPKERGEDFESDMKLSIDEHIKALWNVLKRKPDEAEGTLIPLPFSYVVPGGRFREIYYWDSYFTMLGLKASGEIELMQNMVANFDYLIQEIGYIPNGNRIYYLGRSQPPFFSLMVKLLAESSGNDVLTHYLPSLEEEWMYWNDSAGLDEVEKGANSKVVKLSTDAFYLRYWDENDTPRAESYKEDVELAEKSKQNDSEVFRHLRSAAESGWDFSHRWFGAKDDFPTIHTTDILPIDLNCLNLYMTEVLSEIYSTLDDEESAMKKFLFMEISDQIKKCFSDYFWNEKLGFFTDYDFVKEEKRDILTLAGVFPLFFGIATEEQAKNVAHVLETQFLKFGGLTTTLFDSGQQWDAPNGWAPLQWIAYKGLQRYGFEQLADEVRSRWMNTCEKVYEETGKMTEKYNVWNENASASGGEYPNQDGFGWTNGVYLAMKHRL